jgi:hypothetical protein
MSKTISATITTGYTLSSASNPLSITATGSISKSAATGGHAAIYGAGGSGTNWTITNSGRVGGTATSLFGINLGYFGPTVTSALIINNLGGTIAGQQYGIITDGPTTITNQSGGTLSANGNDIVFLQTQGTIFNYGLAINTNATGLYLQGGGVVVNGATGTISTDPAVSGIGVRLNAVGTVTNAGTIIGGTGGAVGFEATSTANELIVDPGAVFQGGINGGTGLLALASAASAGVLGTFGSSGITNFSTLQFDSGSKWTIKGNATTVTSGGFGSMVMTGFTSTDTIDLLNFSFSGASETFANNALILTNSAAQHATLHIQGALTTGDFHISSYAGGTGTTIIDCFAAGTPIATPEGAVPVENLAVGQMVRTHFAGSTPIQWIGRRHVDCERHPDPRNVWPVRVSAGAFGKGRPRRDLFLSPNHAIYVGNVLIPVGLLINGISIAQIQREAVTYYHIELAQHDLLMTEGLLSESYLDVGDRSNFAEGHEPMRLFPDFGAPVVNVAALWETAGCAPLVIRGPILEAAKSHVNRFADSGVQAGVGDVIRAFS